MTQARLTAALIAAALVLMAAGVWIISAAGLPERRDTNSFITASGERIAPEMNALAPPFETLTFSGGAFSLTESRGVPVVLNFWATWCAPCAVEMPELQRLHEDYAARGLRIVGVNLGESDAAVNAWRERFALTFELARDPDLNITALYQARGQPYTVVIAPDGVIVAVFFGATTYEAVYNAVAPFLEPSS